MLTLSPTNTAVPADTNNSSLVFKLIHGDTSILFTGDISQSVERYLANRFGELLRADVLKVAHHGSDSSSAQMFLSAVSPQWAVISAGADNAYGHPDSTVIDRLQAAGATTVCTCDVGTVTFVSDGKEFEKTD